MSDEDTLPPNSAIRQWSDKIFEAGMISILHLLTDQRAEYIPAFKQGTDIAAARSIKQWMEQTGFIDVQEHILKLPIGPWARDLRLKKCGLFERVNWTEGKSFKNPQSR